jgi:hypothetical protein
MRRNTKRPQAVRQPRAARERTERWSDLTVPKVYHAPMASDRIPPAWAVRWGLLALLAACLAVAFWGNWPR